MQEESIRCHNVCSFFVVKDREKMISLAQTNGFSTFYFTLLHLIVNNT